MIESITRCVASDDRTDHRMRVDGLQLNDHRNESGAGRQLIVWALQISNEPAREDGQGRIHGSGIMRRYRQDALGDNLAAIAELGDDDLHSVQDFVDALITQARLKTLSGGSA
jgi:hypothetical protein